MINRQSFRIIKALMIKEFYQILRDPSTLILAIGLPILLLFIYGYGVSLDMNTVKVGVVLEDNSPTAESLLSSFQNSPYFDITVRRDIREFKQELIRGNIRGIIVIPEYFSEFRLKPDTMAPIEVIADGSEPNSASFVQNYAKGAFQNWLQQEAISRKLQHITYLNPQFRFWFNQRLESRDFLIPGSIAIIMTLIGTLLTSLVVAREWERGTMEALMSTPINMIELLLGKLIPYFLLGMVSMAICFFVAILYYHVPFRGTFLLLGICSASFLISALSLGLLISTLAKNQFVAAQAAIVAAFLPGFILSGFIFELSSLPLPIYLFTYLFPARYFVSSLQTLFLAGNVHPLILFNIIPMWIFALVLFTIISRINKKRLE
ncbi:MAG: ABC transporter permease [Parachlamydiaceae bacterium]